LRSSGLLSGLFVPDAVANATSDRAWVQAMLDFEAALAGAEAETGAIPAEAAEAIAAACDAERFDPDALGVDARPAGNPIVPLVRALTEAAGEEAGRWVHWGATSQDVMDSASMLVARRALEPIDADLARVAAACARLAEEHRDTPIAGRTLMQQALPTTFGLKAAGWLVGVRAARERFAAVRLYAQLGGAAGTLASLGDKGPRVAALLAQRLGLEEPPLPWHTMRVPVADLGAALALAAGAVEKIALDVVLLAQTEVGEVAEPAGGGRGGSSTLPHKRNPIGAALARACAREVRGAASVLLAAMAGEHERAAGAWHSEWSALTDALASTGGAAAAIAEALEGLEVRPERMAANLDATGGLLMAESVSIAIAGAGMSRLEAKELVGEASRRAVEGGRTLRDELLEDERVSERLSPKEIDRALDPSAYLGAAGELVDRAVELHRREGGKS
jgi:3-carboxy-cis,cis-muconate cycloisomerase